MHAGKICQCSVEVFSREGISQSKMETLQRYGAKITRYGNDCVEAEVKARETAQVSTCHQPSVNFPQIFLILVVQ